MTRVNADGTRRVLDAAGRAGVQPCRAALERGGLRRMGEQPGAADRGCGAAPESRLPPRDPRRRVRTRARRVGERQGRSGGDAPARRAGRRRGVELGARGGRDRSPARDPARTRRARAGRARRRRRERAAASRSSSRSRVSTTSRPTVGSRPKTPTRWHPRRHLPGIPYEAAERVLQVMWGSGFGDAPPAIVPYLAYPWVVANDRMQRRGLGAESLERGSDPPRIARARRAASCRGSRPRPRSSWRVRRDVVAHAPPPPASRRVAASS